jgi:uncharacterized membrane protein
MTGTIVFQTFVMYPNIFVSPPESLQLSMQFFSTITPGDFFPVFGSTIVTTGILCLLVSYKFKVSFYWFLTSVLLLFVGDGILSVLYFWPLNQMLFVEGTEQHSVEALRIAARDFHNAHYIRLFTSILASISAMFGLLRSRDYCLVHQV